MTKRTRAPNDKRKVGLTQGVADESQPFRNDPLARFAPADNLYDAIRADVAAIGGVEFQPLLRAPQREYPFNDIDWNPFDDE